MENKLKILGFAGSLRKGSYNRSLLRSATQLLPSDTALEIFDLSDIPPYNQDHDDNIPPKGSCERSLEYAYKILSSLWI